MNIIKHTPSQRDTLNYTHTNTQTYTHTHADILYTFMTQTTNYKVWVELRPTLHSWYIIEIYVRTVWFPLALDPSYKNTIYKAVWMLCICVLVPPTLSFVLNYITCCATSEWIFKRMPTTTICIDSIKKSLQYFIQMLLYSLFYSPRTAIDDNLLLLLLFSHFKTIYTHTSRQTYLEKTCWDGLIKSRKPYEWVFGGISELNIIRASLCPITALKYLIFLSPILWF